jgi:acyl carrier protein
MGDRVRAETAEDQVTRVLLEYADRAPTGGALSPTLSLRRDLAIESLALVSVMVRIGEELGVDLAEASLELVGVETVGDVTALARGLAARARATSAA